MWFKDILIIQKEKVHEYHSAFSRPALVTVWIGPVDRVNTGADILSEIQIKKQTHL